MAVDAAKLKALNNLGALVKILIREIRENSRIVAQANKIPHKVEELPEDFDELCKEPASVDELPELDPDDPGSE